MILESLASASSSIDVLLTNSALKADLIDAGVAVSTIAGVFSAVTFVPQLIKTMISRSTVQMSFLMTFFGVIASLLWVIFGALSMAQVEALTPINNDFVQLYPQHIGNGGFDGTVSNGAYVFSIPGSSLSASTNAATTAAPIWTNALMLLLTFALVTLKAFNISKAKKANITEKAYCEKVAIEKHAKYANKNSSIAKWMTKVVETSAAGSSIKSGGNK